MYLFEGKYYHNASAALDTYIAKWEHDNGPIRIPNFTMQNNRDIKKAVHTIWNSLGIHEDYIDVSESFKKMHHHTGKIGMFMMALPTEVLGGAVLILIVCLFSASHVFRYYTKFLLFIILSLISGTIFMPIMFLRPRDYKNALLPAWGARQISKLLGIHWEMKGTENIVPDSGCVIVINHQSGLDLLVLAELWPVVGRCTVIAKRELFYLWPFGLAAWLWGTIFIDRLNNEQAQATINQTGEHIRNQQLKLCMFPEGTRHLGKELLPFKKGAFHVAIASQTPVQPVVVSKYHFLDAEKHIFNSGHSIIKILPPIPTEGLTKLDIDTLVSQTYSIMSEEFTKLSSEIVTEGSQ